MPLTKAQAKALAILDVAKSLGMELKRSSHNEYYWIEHDALKLNTTKNNWTWYSRSLYGDTIDLVQEIKQVSYKDAISFLSGGHYQTVSPHEEKREPFTYYLERYEHPDFEFGRQYLKKERGLSDDTIDTFLASGNLAVATYKKGDYFEPVIVFKSRDPKGQLLGASLQGIVENRARYLERGRLKKIMPNSDGSVGFSLTLGQAKRLVFAESPIDLMSYYEIHQETLKDVRLVAMDGLKRSVISRHLAYLQAELTGRPIYGKDKIRQSLTEAKKQGFFNKDKNKHLITLAVDNDPAGRGFVESLQKDGIPVIADLPPKSETQAKMDWNDVLKHTKKEKIQMENHAIKKPNKDQLALFDNLADLTPSKAKKKSQTKEADAVLTSYGSFRIDDEFLESRYGTKPEEDAIVTALNALKRDLSLEGIGVDNDPTECAFVSTVDVEGYQLDLAVYSHHDIELELHGRYDWSLLVLDKTEPLGFLAYGEDWFREQADLKDKLTDLQAWITEGSVKEHLLTQQDYSHFLEDLEEKGTKKAPENLQEATTTISEQQKMTGHMLGDLPEQTQEAAPLPEAKQSQPLNDLLPNQTQDQSFLHFTISNPKKSIPKAGYHIATKRDLERVNSYAQGLQEAAKWYLSNLANSSVFYIYQEDVIKKPVAIKIKFEERQFMHLTGLFPIQKGQTAEKTLHDFASGNGDFDNLMVANRGAVYQKLQVLPELQDILRTDAFYFDNVTDIPKLHNIDMAKAIKSDAGSFVTAFKNNSDNTSYPATLLELTPELQNEFSQASPGKTILGIYRERDGQLEQIAINEDYVKDGGKAFFDVLSHHDLEPLIEDQSEVAIAQEEVSRDFDGDGIPDDEEKRQGTDPYDARSNTYNNDSLDDRLALPEAEESLEGLVEANKKQDKVAKVKVDRTIADMIKAKDTATVNRYLKEGIKNYLNSEKYKAFLSQMSKLNHYSPRNLQLLLAQKPDATYLASYNTWKKDFGRQVKKGEKALSVIMPVTYLKKDKEGNVLLDKNGKPETITTFRLQARVFDVSQTEGKDLPQQVTNLRETLTDEQYANLYRATMTIAKANHLTVRFDKLPEKTNGYFNPKQNEIVIQQDNMSKDQIVKTFLHELAHAELHQAGQQAELPENLKKLQAESTAFVVASYYGLNTENYTFSYLASWTDDKKTLADLEAQLDVVHQEAQSLIKRMDDTLAEIQLRQERQRGHQFSNKLEQFKEKTAKDIASHREHEKQKEAEASKKAKGVSK